jgi:hypothetical protein
MDGFLNEVQIRGSAREQEVPPMLQLAEHDKHTVCVAERDNTVAPWLLSDTGIGHLLGQ